MSQPQQQDSAPSLSSQQKQKQEESNDQNTSNKKQKKEKGPKPQKKTNKEEEEHAIPLDIVTLHPALPLLLLQRSKSELSFESDRAQGGLTAFQNLPIQLLKQYIYTVCRPNELTPQNLDTIFSSKKEEFCICAMYAPPFVDLGVQLGLLPMTIRMGSNLPEFLALKLHKNRCVVRLNNPDSVQIPHGVRGKKSKKFTLVVDGGLWDTCVKAITLQHEKEHGHSWLNAYLSRCFCAMNVDPQKYKTNFHCISVVHTDKMPMLVSAKKVLEEACDTLKLQLLLASSPSSSSSSSSSAISSSTSSNENKEQNNNNNNSGSVERARKSLAEAQDIFNTVAKEAFAAGEIGCSCGSFYTSLTGGHVANGAGSVQLGALAALLVQCGFQVWDLGMAMEYKTDGLGGTEIRRNQWVALSGEKGKIVPPRTLASLDGYAVRADKIIDAGLPTLSSSSATSASGSSGQQQQQQQQQQTKQDSAATAASSGK